MIFKTIGMDTMEIFLMDMLNNIINRLNGANQKELDKICQCKKKQIIKEIILPNMVNLKSKKNFIMII